MGIKNKIVAFALSLSSLSFTSSYAQPSLSAHDVAIARRLEAVCDKGGENMVLYLPEIGNIVDITYKSSKSRLIDDQFKAQSTLKSYDKVIDAHCHTGEYKNIFQVFKDLEMRGIHLKDEVRQMKKLPRDVLEGRIINNIPSIESRDGLLAGDMFNAVWMEVLHRMMRPNAEIEHRIVVVTSNSPLKVVGYGLSDEYKERLREGVASMGPDGFAAYLSAMSGQRQSGIDGDVNNFFGSINSLIKDYFDVSDGFDRSHCFIWSPVGCVEPRHHDLAARINATGKFFVKEIGELPRKR